MSKALPIVSIVGRANVGKSSLFNRLVDKRRAIVSDIPGTTRDNVMEKTQIGGKPLLLVDTAGLKTPEDELEMSIKEQIEHATDVSNLILVTVDGGVGLTDEDRRVAKLALKSKTPVILIVNKVDKAHKKDLSLFNKLGIKEMIGVSCTQGTGLYELDTAIAAKISKVTKTPTSDVKIALLGRPNVGKSLLFNKFINQNRAIVADIAGTTRDVNRAEIEFENSVVEIMDTAGVRRNAKSSKGIEYYSALRTRAAIEEADVCILLIDALEAGTKLDQKIAGMVKEAGKGLIIAINKWDLVEKDENTFDKFSSRLGSEFQFVNWAQIMAISAQEGKNINKMIESALEIVKQRNRKFTTSELNRWLRNVVAHHPPAGLKNTHPRLMYITQTDVNPPMFVIYGHDTKTLHWSYKRYLEREFRQSHQLYGSAIMFFFKSEEKRKK